jgi:Holliday junction DNA helicase RuvA
VYEHVRGTLEERSPAHAVVEAGGVGYFLSIPLSTYERLPPLGSEVRLFTRLVFVRDDVNRLFGFATKDERAFFVTLQSVSGVGPSVAIGIVSAMPWAAFQSAIAAGDAAALRRVRGIGKRLSERLVVELRDKLGATSAPAPASAAPADVAAHDALLALEQLGFARDDATEALRELRREDPSLGDAGELVRRALARL